MDEFRFDEHSMNRIYELMILKGKCLQYHCEHVLRLSDDHEFDKNTPHTTFYLSMSDIIDVHLINFLNEEVSASHRERNPLEKIINHVNNKASAELDKSFLSLCSDDLFDLFSNRIDFYIGSSFVDFSVNSFSTFECWVCKLYDEIKARKESKDTKLKKIEKIIAKHIDQSTCSDSITKIAEEIYNEFIYTSGSEKIDYILSCLDKYYDRDQFRDKKIVSLCRIKRNTVHNLGVNFGKSIEFMDDDIGNISANTGNAFILEDYRSDIKLCSELVDIYKNIINNIRPTHLENLLQLKGQ